MTDTKDTTPSRTGRGRPRKPQLIELKDGFSVRYWAEREGTQVRIQEPLGTTSRVVARARMKQVVAGLVDARELGAVETFEAAARRLVPTMPLKGKGPRARMSRLERFAFPIIGRKKVSAIESPHVKDVLAAAIEHHGKRTTAVKHLFIDISVILGVLHSDNILKENVCDRISFGGVEPVRPPPCVPTMAEFERMVGYHLARAEREGTGLPEVLVMAIVARCLGGMRTSDLHAWCWEMIDTRQWAWALVPRPKLKKDTSQALHSLARHAIPSDLVPVLMAWWSQHGAPLRGPVFPMRRDRVVKSEPGEGGLVQLTVRTVGSRKGGNISYAKKLRRLFWEAGVTRPLPGFELAEDDEARRELCELQSGGDDCGPVDFHSLRRAFVTDAAGDETLSMQAAMELVDHRDPRTHLGYKAKTKVLVAPEKIIPRILPSQMAEIPVRRNAKHNDSGRVRSDSNARPIASEATGKVSPRGFSRGFSGRAPRLTTPKTPGDDTERQNATPVIRERLVTPSDALRDAIAEALDRGDLEEARDLLDVARRRAAALPQAAE
jgi:integrase